MTMHAVVVRQPWASLIAHGIKTIETRGFAPKSTVRPGDRLAIVAGKTKVGLFDSPAATDGWRPLMDGIGSVDARYAPLPLGVVVAVVTYDEALPVVAPATDPPYDHLVPTSDGHLVWWRFTPVLGQRRWSAASRHPMLNERTVVGGRRDPDLDPQLPLGGFTPGRYGWMLSNPLRLTVPVPCPAVAPDGTRINMQGVFRLPAAVEAAVAGQIGGES